MAQHGDALDRYVVEAAGGDSHAIAKLVRVILPVIEARVARVMLRSRARLGRDIRQDVEDFSQDVLVSLLADDFRVLRSWDPQRGLSLRGFVGLVAERQAASLLRSARRSPWREQPQAQEDMELAPVSDSRGPFAVLASRESLALLTERLNHNVTALGQDMFRRLYIHQDSIDEICCQTGMQEDAVYAWRSRLGRLARKLLGELDGTADRRHGPEARGERGRPP